MPISPDDLRTRMQKLGEFIADAEDTIRGGKMVDMSGLDRDVTEICQLAATLPPAHAITIQPDMADLIGRVERLSMALRDYKDIAKK